MSNKHKPLWDVDINCWYTTFDNKDLYKVVFKSPSYYNVIRFYDGEAVFSGSVTQCKKFICSSCYSHDAYVQRAVNLNGK